jgi:hypothetical protein
MPHGGDHVTATTQKRRLEMAASLNPAAALMIGFFGLVILGAARAMFRR